MKENSTENRLETAAISDRGLNPRRPLNEDAHFSDASLGVFVVADGVGGAEAGEVASQTAIEVLEKAFRHINTDEDVEDLMEIAIQRANASIFRKSREDAKLAMMATTVVALHLNGARATVGHVGDSRLYTVSPNGEIRRETEDHSVVEEEVRAGRMTPEQAVNHPSRNVISRALGAESDVEVDLKTFEVERGTTFLLCTDGITRHITDEELAAIIRDAPDFQTACDEFKRRCYERGAEDNLTAILVRAGEKQLQTLQSDDDEKTIIAESDTPTLVTAASIPQVAAASNSEASNVQNEAHAPSDYDNARSSTGGAHVSDVKNEEKQEALVTSPSREAAGGKKKGGAGRFFIFLFFLAIFSAAAFYGGMLYQQRFAPPRAADVEHEALPSQGRQAAAVPTAAAPDVTDEERVDMNAQREAERMSSVAATSPEDPKSLYLYGRALLLSNRPQEAVVQFDKALRVIEGRQTSDDFRIRTNAYLAAAAAHLRANDVERARAALEKLFVTYPSSASPSASPQPTQAVTASPQF